MTDTDIMWRQAEYICILLDHEPGICPACREDHCWVCGERVRLVPVSEDDLLTRWRHSDDGMLWSTDPYPHRAMLGRFPAYIAEENDGEWATALAVVGLLAGHRLRSGAES